LSAPRKADRSEVAAIATLWHEAWHETQAPFVPYALIRLRTMDEFKNRVAEMISNTDTLRVAGATGAPIGMCAIKPDELYQLFVAPAGRGSGIAAALLDDAEQRLVAAGSKRAFLDCLDENEPAKRFYSRQGWVPTGVQTTKLETSDGPFTLPCMIFEKELSRDVT
jgi:GNAT superfamily N-acetyltransferase